MMPVEMLKKNILVVDDESDLCEILKFNLENEGYLVDTAGSAEEALEIMKESTYQLILLDVMMSGMSGFKMAEHLHKELKDNTPIIFLTARDSENDMLTGFSVGGDDYIAKPFSLKEVLVRAKAVIKRAETQGLGRNAESSMKINNFEIDFNAKIVTIDGTIIPLTKTEFEILCHLAKNEGKIFSRENILSMVWPDDTYVLDRTVDVHITRLRKKLGEYGNWIRNRSGYGYCFEPYSS